MSAGNILSMYKRDSIWTDLYFVSTYFAHLVFLSFALVERQRECVTRNELLMAVMGE